MQNAELDAILASLRRTEAAVRAPAALVLDVDFDEFVKQLGADDVALLALDQRLAQINVLLDVYEGALQDAYADNEGHVNWQLETQDLQTQWDTALAKMQALRAGIEQDGIENVAETDEIQSQALATKAKEKIDADINKTQPRVFTCTARLQRASRLAQFRKQQAELTQSVSDLTRKSDAIDSPNANAFVVAANALTSEITVLQKQLDATLPRASADPHPLPGSDEVEAFRVATTAALQVLLTELNQLTALANQRHATPVAAPDAALEPARDEVLPEFSPLPVPYQDEMTRALDSVKALSQYLIETNGFEELQLRVESMTYEEADDLEVLVRAQDAEIIVKKNTVDAAMAAMRAALVGLDDPPQVQQIELLLLDTTNVGIRRAAAVRDLMEEIEDYKTQLVTTDLRRKAHHSAHAFSMSVTNADASINAWNAELAQGNVTKERADEVLLAVRAQQADIATEQSTAQTDLVALRDAIVPAERSELFQDIEALFAAAAKHGQIVAEASANLITTLEAIRDTVPQPAAQQQQEPEVRENAEQAREQEQAPARVQPEDIATARADVDTAIAHTRAIIAEIEQSRANGMYLHRFDIQDYRLACNLRDSRIAVGRSVGQFMCCLVKLRAHQQDAQTADNEELMKSIWTEVTDAFTSVSNDVDEIHAKVIEGLEADKIDAQDKTFKYCPFAELEAFADANAKFEIFLDLTAATFQKMRHDNKETEKATTVERDAFKYRAHADSCRDKAVLDMESFGFKLGKAVIVTDRFQKYKYEREKNETRWNAEFLSISHLFDENREKEEPFRQQLQILKDRVQVIRTSAPDRVAACAELKRIKETADMLPVQWRDDVRARNLIAVENDQIVSALAKRIEHDCDERDAALFKATIRDFEIAYSNLESKWADRFDTVANMNKRLNEHTISADETPGLLQQLRKIEKDMTEWNSEVDSAFDSMRKMNVMHLDPDTQTKIDRYNTKHNELKRTIKILQSALTALATPTVQPPPPARPPPSAESAPQKNAQAADPPASPSVPLLWEPPLLIPQIYPAFDDREPELYVQQGRQDAKGHEVDQHTEQTRDDHAVREKFVLAQMTVPLAQTLAALVVPPAPAPPWPAREPVRARRAQPAPPDSAARALCARVAHIARLACHSDTAALAALRLAAELAPPLVALALAPPAPSKGARQIDRAALRAALAPAALAPLLRRAALASSTLDRAARAAPSESELEHDISRLWSKVEVLRQF